MASTPTPPDVPFIAVDAPSTPDLHQHEQHIPEIAVSSGSTDDLLPPTPRGAAPPSPTGPADSPTNASSDLPPPSPTLSARSLASSAPSVHFAPQHTTLDLRENRPSDLDGKSSLGLLSLPQPSHRRRGSAATTSSAYTATTVADGSDIGLVPLSSSPSPSPSPGPLSDAGSTLASPTRTHVSDDAEDEFSSRASLNKKHRHTSSSPSPSPSPSPALRGDANEDGGAGGSQKKAELARPEHLDLAQEADVDPAPFGAKPLQLANLVDPKSIEALEALGGVEGLLHALGTHPMRGLEDDTGVVAGTGEEGSPRISNDTRKPSITLTAPGVDDSTSARVPSLHGSRSSSNSHLGSNNTDPYRASVADRVRVFGANVLPVRKSKSIWALMWAALTDKLLIVLSIAAVVSLALGFFQDFGPAHKPGDPQVDWVEGVAIIVAILVVVLVGSLNDYQKEKQFQVLNAKKDERAVKVIRAGVEALVSVYDVVVGDVALLEPGEIVPCDGVFLRGHNVRCDESGATGESDAIKKATFDECVRVRDERLASYRGRGRSGSSKDADGEDDEDGVDKDDKPSGMELLGHTDCFIVSGSRVLEGVGAYVIIAVGTRSFNGRIMMALRGDAEDTPLQQKLNSLADAIAWAGTTVGIILFVGLMIRFFVEIGTGVPPRTPSEKGIAFVDILIISVTLVVVAVPEGLPLAVTLALAFATKRMTAENLLVRVLGSCETMANASVVCTDKTGTLTQNEMAVVAGSIGIHAKFVRQLDENRARAAVGDRIEGAGGSGKGDDDAAGKNARARKHAEDWSLDLASLSSALPPQLSTLLNASIAVNSTAFFDAEADAFVGSKTEIALLKMVKELGWEDYRVVRERAEVVQVVPFSSERKAMGVVVKNGSRGARIFVKGASEILTERCARHVVVRKDDNDGGGGKGREVDGGEVESAVMGELDRDNIERTITFYAGQTLRTIALCYRDFESWPPEGCTVEDGEVPYDEIARDMTLIGITGIEDPLRPGVREAVANCALAGVQVKMCTGDNVLTARSIAQQCGIYSPGGIVMEGPHFRNLPDSVRAQIVPRLQVLARSSPEDKKILVESLKNLGEIVGVTGDGTNDGPALKTANVGFSMGIAGTEVAKEASDIILMDDNFASIVKAIMWGRAVNDAVRKFLQFQISTNVTAVVITIVSGLASANEDPVLTAVQLLWVNIIMDTFAALALATDPASPALLDRKPDRKWAPLFSVDMLKQIVGQSIYQTTIILVFHFLGARILGFGTNEQDRRVTTLVFNAFVFAQIFNSLNCRRLDRKFNIFEGLTRNWFFIGITLIEVGAQVLIVFVGKSAFSVTRIAGREWGISLALGFVSIPLGALIRLVPNEPCKRVFAFFRLYREPPLLPTTAPDTPEPGLGFALDMLRDNLGAFRRVRGGRLRSSSFVVKSMSGVKGRRGDEEGVVPGLLAMLPSLVGAHIVGSNWAGNAHGLADPAGFDPSKSSAALWENRFEVHPDTPADDPVFRLLKQTGGRRT